MSYLSGHKQSIRSVRQPSLVGRLAEFPADLVKTPMTPDMFQRASA